MTALSKPVVAIVDDDRRILEALEELLGSSGYAVCLFPDATELLKGHSLSDFDCLICDICMPGMRGTESRKMHSEVRILHSNPGIYAAFVLKSRTEWIGGY
jgi:FixJ family two-component response regulator